MVYRASKSIIFIILFGFLQLLFLLKFRLSLQLFHPLELVFVDLEELVVCFVLRTEQIRSSVVVSDREGKQDRCIACYFGKPPYIVAHDLNVNLNNYNFLHLPIKTKFKKGPIV